MRSVHVNDERAAQIISLQSDKRRLTRGGRLCAARPVQIRRLEMCSNNRPPVKAAPVSHVR